jgi:hypothetical protein
MYTSLTHCLHHIRGVERKVEVESHSEFSSQSGLSLSRGWVPTWDSTPTETQPRAALLLNAFFSCIPPWHIVHHSRGWEESRGWVPFRVQSQPGLGPIRGWVPVEVESQSGLSPFGVESQSGLSPFGVQSHLGFSPIRGWVHSGLGPFGVGSIRGSDLSRLSLSRFGLSRFSRSRFSR